MIHCTPHRGMFGFLYNNKKKKLRKIGWLVTLLSPYGLLVLLFLINALMHGDAHCPLPTILERDIWFFPSVMHSWLFYVVAIPFVEILLVPLWLVISSMYLSIKGIFKPKVRKTAWRRVFIALPGIVVVIGALIGLGVSFLIEYFGWFFGFSLRELQVFAMIAVGVITVLGTFGVSIWLLVAGILEKRRGTAALKQQGTRTILAATLGFLFLFVIPAYFSMIIVINSLGSYGYHNARSISIPTTNPSLTSGSILRSQAISVPFASLDTVSFSETIGFAVGGAKDADNFRENITSCYLPIPTDITHEGLYFDYEFVTKNETGCTALFCPQYEAAVLPDPFSKKDEYFLSVGLGSNLKVEDFARPPLDVVIVLDVSGSMSSAFDKYYYDRFRKPGQLFEDLNDWNTSKMEIAKESVNAMVDHLQPNDRFGMVLFESTASQFIPFERINDTGYKRIKDQVKTLSPTGGTNMEAGLTLGTQVIESLPRIAGEDRERRIIFLTDAMPNQGALKENELYRIGSANADKGIHTTFIGIGVDFNTELVDALTKELRGANYFAVHSSSDFEKRLDTEFEYLIAPLLYDLTLTINGGDYEIRKVYGSPEANKATGDVLKVSSLFPSPTSEGSSKGGVILAHMKQVSNSGRPTKVIARYTDRRGVEHVEDQNVIWTREAKSNPSANVRKAALLARYVNLMQNWTIDENLRQGPHEKTIYVPVETRSFYTNGLLIPEERYSRSARRHGGRYVPVELSQWERLSRSLVVSKDYKEVFDDFMDYFEEEYRGLSERNLLKRELKILDDLGNSPRPSRFGNSSTNR